MSKFTRLDTKNDGSFITVKQMENIKNGQYVTRNGAINYAPNENHKRKRSRINKFFGMKIVERHQFFLGEKNGTVFHAIKDPSLVSYNLITNETNVSYTFNGYQITKTSNFCYLCDMDDEETCMWILKYGDTLPTFIVGDPYDLGKHLK